MEVLKVIIILHTLGVTQAFNNTPTAVQKKGIDDISNRLEEKNQTETYIPRLSNNCSGVLEAFHNGTWIAVQLTLKSMTTAHESICKNLGCGTLYEAALVKPSPNTPCLTDCVYASAQLSNCKAATQSYCSSVNMIKCWNPSIRLTGGQHLCAGRVEIWNGSQWGTVCDDGWDVHDGHVVCAQLGCGDALRVTGEGGAFGSGGGQIFLTNVSCTGNEAGLHECQSRKQTNDCGHKEDAGVVCSESGSFPTTHKTKELSSTRTWTTGVRTTQHTEAGSERLSPAVAGCIALTLILLTVPVVNVMFCQCYRRRNAVWERIPWLNTIMRHPRNDYMETDDRPNIPTDDVSNGGPTNAQQLRSQDRSDSPSFDDSDYEHYDFSAEPAVALAVYRNSVYDRPENRSPVMASSTTACLYHTEPDSSSTSSGEGYMNYGSGHNATASVDLLESSSTSSGEEYENTGCGLEDLLTQAVPLSPEASKTPSLMGNSDTLPPGDSILESISDSAVDSHRPADKSDPGDPFPPTPQIDADSASSSSDSDYQNVGWEAQPTVTGDATNSSSDDDYVNVADCTHISPTQGLQHKQENC